MRLSKAKVVVALGAVAAVAVGAVLVLQTDDGSEASRSPGVGIEAAAAQDRGQFAQPRIIGGGQVNIEQYPWQVAIRRDNAAMPPVWCGGTLVAPTIVITAAHCLYDKAARKFSPPSRFTVISGRTVLSSNQGVETAISNYYYRADSGTPLYDPDSKAWDVAVMVLTAPRVGGVLKIADADDAQSWAPGATAWISGWGSTDDGFEGTYPDHLQATTVKIIDDARCTPVYDHDVETSLCAGDTTAERDTCSGDSGGPLVVSLPDGQARLVGATSYGKADCGNINAPGVYTRLAADPIRSWVQGAVQELAGVDIVG